MTAVVVTGSNIEDDSEREIGTYSQGIVIESDKIIDIANGEEIAIRGFLSPRWYVKKSKINQDRIHIQAITTKEDS